MSANMEKSESLPRVTRSMRRMNSSDSLNQDNERPETPTGRLRATKKLESIDETAITPTRRSTRAGSVQKTLAVESTTPASPLRRVTRRMSNDNAEVVPSPRLIKRAPNKRTVTESDDDDVIFVNEMPITPRTKSVMKRLSVNLVKLEEVAEELPEIEASEEKQKNDKSNELNKSVDLNKSADLNKSTELNKSAELFDLELRNRSISKSPLVIQRNSISSNDASSVQDITKDSVQEISNDSVKSNDNSMETNAKSTSPIKSLKNKSSGSNETSINIEIAQEKPVSPSKSPQKKSSLQNITNGSVEIQSNSENNDLSRRRNSRRSLASIAETVSDDLISQNSSLGSQKSKSPLKSPQNNFTNYRKNVLEPFTSNEDNLGRSDSEGSNLAIQVSKSPEKGSQSSQEKDNNDDSYLPLQKVHDIVEYFEKEKLIFKPKDYTKQNTENSAAEIVPTEIESTKSEISDQKEQSIMSKDSGFSNKADESVNKGNDEVVAEMLEDFVPAQKPVENELKKTPSFFNKTQMNTVDMDIGSDEEQSTLDETNKQDIDMEITTVVSDKKSPVKKNKSNSWNQSVTGSSLQIDSLKKPESTEVIHETSSKKKKVISSDESEGESETERNSFIDDEAEVASDEEDSMTKSERDEMEQNEIVEDGESLGSQDSDELDENSDELDDEEDDDSFIDKDEDIDDQYSMDSDDKLLEQEELNKSKSKRRSRIIVQSSSESDDEIPKSTQKSPAKAQEPEKSPVKSQNNRKSLPNFTESSESPLKTRKSLPNFTESSESPSKALNKSAKKSRKSNIQEEAEKALSDAEKAISDAEKALSDAENSQTPSKSRRKKSKLLSQAEAEKALSDAEKAISDAEKALSDAENAERVLKTLNKSAKKNRKSLPNLDENEKIPKSDKKLRKTISSIDVEPSHVEKLQSPLKAVQNSPKNIQKSNDEALESSDISSAQNNSFDKSDTTAKESSQEDNRIGKKRKREAGDENSDSKRFRKMSANESEAVHMDNYSNLVNRNDSSDESEPVKEKKKKKDKNLGDEMEIDEEVPVKKCKKKQKAKEIDFSAILNRCNEYMEKTKEEKKAKMALKKERKAKKLEKKKMEKELAVSTEEKLDSSTGENKENAEKVKKKKNKSKKLKLVDEIDDGKKEGISARLDKLQQKLELKKQRKKEKKLAKMAEQASQPEQTAEKKNEKSQKVIAEQQAGPSKLLSKKEKVAKIQTEPVESVEVEKAKKKKHKLVEEIQPEVKVKKSKKHAELTQIPIQEESAPAHDKKKAKKRPISEIIDENDTEVVEKPKAKKKLNILKEVESSSQVSSFKKSIHNKEVETIKPTSTLTSKLNKVIPKGLGNEVKQVAKKKRKVVEEKKPIKRPVWTSAGMFIEEPVTPYKFKTTDYKTVNFGPAAATKAKVVIFSAQKSSKPVVVDHKMQAIMKKNKNRDKSIKNLKNLM